jgi:hypothetical protein
MSEEIGPAWFASRNIPMYLLAFGANEQSGWADRLLDKFHMQPDLVVFDADPYFTGKLAVPSSVLFQDVAAEEKSARATKAFLDAAPAWCRFLPWLCGRTERSYRTFRDGSIIHQDRDRVWFNRNEAGNFPIPTPEPQDTSHYDEYLGNARALLARLHVRPECVVLTVTPNSEMDDTLAKFLASHLGASVIAPRPDGLATSDHFHLNEQSAQDKGILPGAGSRWPGGASAPWRAPGADRRRTPARSGGGNGRLAATSGPSLAHNRRVRIGHENKPRSRGMLQRPSESRH